MEDMNMHIKKETVALLEKVMRELLSASKDKITQRDAKVINQIVETIQDKIYIYQPYENKNN